MLLFPLFDSVFLRVEAIVLDYESKCWSIVTLFSFPSFFSFFATKLSGSITAFENTSNFLSISEPFSGFSDSSSSMTSAFLNRLVDWRVFLLFNRAFSFSWAWSSAISLFRSWHSFSKSSKSDLTNLLLEIADFWERVCFFAAELPFTILSSYSILSRYSLPSLSIPSESYYFVPSF